MAIRDLNAEVGTVSHDTAPGRHSGDAARFWQDVAKANDGDDLLYAFVNGGTTNYGCYLKTDLGATYRVSAMVIYIGGAQDEIDHIQYSTDGTNWTTIAFTETGDRSGPSPTTVGATLTFDGGPVDARHFAVHAQKAGGTGGTRLYRWEISGDDIPEDDLVCDFEATPVAGPSPLTVELIDLTIGDPDAWFWNFGDGETSTEQNPTHVYTEAGDYDVSLTASREGGTGGTGGSGEGAGALAFEGWAGSTLDPAWSPLYGAGPGFGTHSDFGANDVAVSGDVLTITATKVGSIWESACISTKGAFSQLYGTWEARIKYPMGKGVWPAFWLLEQQPAVESYPEIDVMEAYPGDPGAIGGPNFFSVALHHTEGEPSHHEIVDTGSDNTDEFHDYKLVWSEDAVVVYYDGILVAAIVDDVPHVPMYGVLNLAVGAPGFPPDGTTPTTLEMEVAHFRVWAP